MKKHKKPLIKINRKVIKSILHWYLLCTGGFIFSLALSIILFENKYKNKVYPNVKIANINFGGTVEEEIKQYWLNKNYPFQNTNFEFRYESQVASISGLTLDIGYDATLSARQAFLVGRSGSVLSDITNKFFITSINLSPFFRWKTDILDALIEPMQNHINIPAEEAMFNFENGKVTAFKPSKNGRQLNITKTKQDFQNILSQIRNINKNHYIINVSVDTIYPTTTTESVNDFGVKELIGTGYSEFRGSIAGRIHNIALSASRFNGILIKPGETFSFNKALGDISAATGYQSAYIIKSGRTVLGDGGGVCQVSTTLFRAALDAGLPIIERRPHAYRVHYYEEGGYKPGLDATVFSPSVDLKILNDTDRHILIQTATNTKHLNLTFKLYGTGDNRKSYISNHRVWDIAPPPPPLYQDDPTLPKGVEKQVDWAAWGAKAVFDYKVVKNNETIFDNAFYSVYRPWQAVYLRGTMD